MTPFRFFEDKRLLSHTMSDQPPLICTLEAWTFSCCSSCPGPRHHGHVFLSMDSPWSFVCRINTTAVAILCGFVSFLDWADDDDDGDGDVS
jgi:hypothetical protein